MSGDVHVRICEGLGVQLPRATRLIVTGSSYELLEHDIKPLVEQFLNERGLELSPEKTRITHIEDGCDFLGHHVRKYAVNSSRNQPDRMSRHSSAKSGKS